MSARMRLGNGKSGRLKMADKATRSENRPSKTESLLFIGLVVMIWDWLSRRWEA